MDSTFFVYYSCYESEFIVEVTICNVLAAKRLKA